MGKPTHGDKPRELDTKILFKKSFNTNLTNSTCCSGVSQLVTKSGCLQIKKNSDGNKLKRDLSIETDACILRRYYKIKRHKMSNQGSSGVSKYSTVVDTEIETIEEFPDTSACGDNEITEERSSHPIDIEALMVANLKSLLGKWIQKNLMYNKDTQNKLDNVLDSILHKLDSKTVHKTSSDSTYVIHKAEQKQQVKNKKIATSSMICQYCKSCRGKIQTPSAISQQDSSTITIPNNYKGIRIISTLSVPRSYHNPKLDQRKSINNLLYKLRKLKRKNLILSIDRSNKLHNSSTFDVIAISTKSLTKRCTYCDSSMKKKRHLVLLPKPYFRKTSSSRNNIKQEKAKAKFEVTDEMSTLLKSLYTTSVDKNVQFDMKNDNFTMTENISEEMSNRNMSQVILQNKIYKEKNIDNAKYTNQNDQPDFYVQDVENDNDQFSSLHESVNTESKPRSSKNAKIIRRKKYTSRKRHVVGHTLLHHYSKFNNVYNRKFTYLYKKTNNPLQGREFVKHCRNIFRYVTEHDMNKNIKVDVRINIYPMVEPGTKDVCTDISNLALATYNEIDSPTLLYDEDNMGSTTMESQPYIEPTTVLNVEYERDPTVSSSHCTAEIIPILDGAVSQAKYIFNENSGEKTEAKSDAVTGDTSQLGILQEISELRAVIKDLATTAEKLVNEQIKKKAAKTNAETHFSQKMSDNHTLSPRYETSVKKNPSKTTQVSVEFEKAQVQSEIVKESKKKDTFDYYNRLTKKSTSYRIIDSESLLKVTDMTSKANDINEYNRRFADEALTCSLPKSRSLFELTSDRNKKLIAFFCDNYVNPKVTCKIRDSRSTAPSPCKSSKTSTKSKKWRFWSKKSSKTKCPNSSTCRSPPPIIPLPIPCPDTREYSSTLSCRSMNSIIDEEDEIVCKIQRRGMGFGEGCVYCLLLWIPVIIILIVFYSYVLRDAVNEPPGNETKVTKAPRLYEAETRSNTFLKNSSSFYLKLSDLGF